MPHPLRSKGWDSTYNPCMAEPFTLRRATPDDAAAILACLRIAFEPFRGEYSPEGFADSTLTAATVHQRLREMSVYVAVAHDGEVIGTVGCHAVGGAKDGHAGHLKNDGHFRGMAVLPGWQGRGVAERLLEAVEQELRALGCTRVTLDTTAPLARAIRFYERHGYRATGRVGDFYGMPLYEYAKAL